METRKCKICNEETKNKKYCSVNCQNISKRGKKLEKWETIKCKNCDSDFDRLKNRTTNIFCSRKCGDEYKKTMKLGIHDPKNRLTSFSDETKKKHSIKTKELWKTKEFREKVKKGQYEKYKQLGHWFGIDKKSLEKKKVTNLKKHGNEYVGWNIKEHREKAENTCLIRYGKYSWEIAHEGLLNKNTKPEREFEKLLIKNKIKYIKQYKIYYDNKKYKYKIFDFLLFEKRILVEIDGDYWHGNSKFFKNLNETQKKNIKNDQFKNELSIKNSFKMLRFWENEIYLDGFEIKMLENLRLNEK